MPTVPEEDPMADQIKSDNDLTRPLSEEHARELMASLTQAEAQAPTDGEE